MSFPDERVQTVIPVFIGFYGIPNLEILNATVIVKIVNCMTLLRNNNKQILKQLYLIIVIQS